MAQDLLGLAPYGESLKILVQGLVNGTGRFLDGLVMPSIDEYGLLLQDHIKAKREKNSLQILQIAQAKIDEMPEATARRVAPKIVYESLNKGSWEDGELLQSMWAGLLASSCSEDGSDDSNMMFVELLGRLTSGQVALLNDAGQRCPVMRTQGGWLIAGKVDYSLSEAQETAGVFNRHALDAQVDNLTALGLTSPPTGFDPDSAGLQLRLSAVALQLFARTQGAIGDVEDFFKNRVERLSRKKLGQVIIDGGGADDD